MNDTAHKKLPRLYVDAPLSSGQTLTLEADQAHYLRSVLRNNVNDRIRMFNGLDGEWTGVLSTIDKKNVIVALDAQSRPQPPARQTVHLLFAPIKKTRLDFLIEKAVELGATHLRPVLTQNTEMRHLNDDRIHAQIAEAAEQCERLDMPDYASPVRLDQALAHWPVEIQLLACIERSTAKPIAHVLKKSAPIALLVGPEGGFTADEIHWLHSLDALTPVTLGPDILRSETAVCYGLAAIGMARVN